MARIFRFIVAKRWLIVAFYALLLPPAAYYAASVGQDSSVDQLIVPTDPDFIATRDFAKTFGSGEYAVLIAEMNDPFDPAVLARMNALEVELAKVEHVDANSALSIFRRAKGGFTATPESAAAFKAFLGGSTLFRKQGLYGEHFLATALIFNVHGRAERDAAIAAIEKAIAATRASEPPITALRRVGAPYVNSYFQEATQRSQQRYFSLFGGLIVALIVFLYRSWRTLVAFIVTIGVCMAVAIGYIGVTGGSFTIVSPMVPMTILVTVTATLVYLHSRFIDCPEGRSIDEHQIFALTNKLLACTASIFATAVGFAALAVSKIRPIREMGIWVAVGLTASWIIIFTLFPALQKIVHPPTSREVKAAAPWFVRFATVLPRFTYTWRWPLVIGALVFSALGGVAIFGLKGVLEPMPLLTNPLEYMNKDSQVYVDTKRIEPLVPGLAITEVWLKGSLGSVSEPETLTGLHRFQQALEADPEVGAAIGPTAVLRLMRYIGNEGDQWPADPSGVESIAGDLEGLVPTQPMLQQFVNRSLSQTHVAIITKASEEDDFNRLDAAIKKHWAEALAASPALKAFEVKTVGLGRLQARMSQNLVPTLVESFGLTVVIIFAAFLLIFRSGAARIMAMIPSVFAILVMFGVMRVSGMRLNVATILIASTVLGTSENDQIHFFYHFLEKRKHGTVEESLRHTLLVSGRAIAFATLINAGGVFAFVFSDVPPMRQFAVLSTVAFVLAMIADFTALPAALWIISREKPDAVAPTETLPT